MKNVLAHWCEESLCHLSMLLSGLVSWMSATSMVKLQQVMPEHEQAHGANGSHQLCDQESEASMAFARCFPHPHCSSQTTPAELSCQKLLLFRWPVVGESSFTSAVKILRKAGPFV